MTNRINLNGICLLQSPTIELWDNGEDWNGSRFYVSTIG